MSAGELDGLYDELTTEVTEDEQVQPEPTPVQPVVPEREEPVDTTPEAPSLDDDSQVEVVIPEIRVPEPEPTYDAPDEYNHISVLCDSENILSPACREEIYNMLDHDNL